MTLTAPTTPAAVVPARANDRSATLLRWLAVGAVYFVAAKAGLGLALVNPSATAVWPPTGIAIAAMILLGPSMWPGVMIGAFLANLTTTGHVAASLGISLGNTLEAAV